MTGPEARAGVEAGPEPVIIDYLGLMSASEHVEARQQQVSEFVRSLAGAGEAAGENFARLANTATGVAAPSEPNLTGAHPYKVCVCRRCGPPFRNGDDWKRRPAMLVSWMALCPACGDKRCPGAQDHDNHPAPAMSVSCHASRDGDCAGEHCPQLRDGDPVATGRHCPLDARRDEE